VDCHAGPTLAVTSEVRTIRIAADVSYRDWLGPIPDDVQLEWFESYDEALAATSDAEVLLLGPNRDWQMDALIAGAERLRWVHTRASGVDGSQLQPASRYRERMITVTNGSGISSIPIAEFVVMAMLAVVKGLPGLMSSHARREWLKPTASRELHGSKVLLIGFGDVGRATWERLKPFGVRATAVRRRPAAEEGIEIIGPDSWRARLGEFDWVVLTAPLTVETHHLMGSSEFSAMNRGGWLLNVSRGAVVDQRALEHALRHRLIGGAFVDVTEPEPLPSGDALWAAPNLIVTPHCSWVSPSFNQRASELFLENLLRWRNGLPLRNVVDLEAGY
jgi:phosphoglycerate dehydrogenase-like enzyme